MTKNKILYSKQFGFQMGHSTGNAIVQLVDQILASFEYNKYTLFNDLSRNLEVEGYQSNLYVLKQWLFFF